MIWGTCQGEAEDACGFIRAAADPIRLGCLDQPIWMAGADSLQAGEDLHGLVHLEAGAEGAGSVDQGGRVIRLAPDSLVEAVQSLCKAPALPAVAGLDQVRAIFLGLGAFLHCHAGH